MPFSHHSHSGQFCKHATNTLEEMIQEAIRKNMRVFALTEHMPRDQDDDLYPEERDAAMTTFDLFLSFKNFYDTALRLRAIYGSQIALPIGYETDYIRPSSLRNFKHMQDLYRFDFVVGSVHHVNTIPIDFDKATYLRAQRSVGGSEERLFEAYFDAQYEMLQNLKPAVVGHFDLIRLHAQNYLKKLSDYGVGVWERVVRNAEFIASYRGLIELNSASLRKGWSTPYPGPDVCELLNRLGVRFCLSDDAHNVSQVGRNYGRTLTYMQTLGIDRIHYLEQLPMGQIAVNVLGACAVREMSITDLEREPFWQTPEVWETG